MSGQESPKTSSNGSAPEFIKVVEKLIDSDEDETLAHKMTQLQKQFPILKKMHPFLNNTQKICLFLRDHNFRNRLSNKLKDQGIFNAFPILKVQLYSVRYHSVFHDQLDGNDVWETFSKFGAVGNFYCDKQFAYIQYNDYTAAYIAIKTLNDFQLEGEVLRISVRWTEDLEETLIAQNYFMALPNIQGQNNHQSNYLNLNPSPVQNPQKQSSKLMCRYDIYLDEYPEFKTAQKIIGPKGSYMKRILERSINNGVADISSVEKLVKLRLRGKGSGYRQGPNSMESDDRLNLCVSSREEQIYLTVCREAQKLLWKVSEDYKLFAQRFGKKVIEGPAYKKIQCGKGKSQLVKELALGDIDCAYTLIEKGTGKKMVENQILEIISKRQKARKCGNWREADEMRNYLKKRGVILVDEKGPKGKERSTKWKFIDQ